MNTLHSAALCMAFSTAALPGAYAQEQADPSIDAKVAAMVAAVDEQRLRQTIDELVAFGTRHVLSRTDSEAAGTGAARAYLEARYRELIPLSGGRLTVAREGHQLSVRRRGMPGELEVVNVVATLPGTTDPDRIYVVGGHYDSRNSSGSDGEQDAPGANDDGSGTAAALEACRVMCTTEFAATIMFVAYDGEEQGLLGSRGHAQTLAEAGAKVDGMITNDIVGNTLGMDGVKRSGYLRCFSYAPRGNDSSGRSLARSASYAARHIDGLSVMLVFRGDRYGRGGDHRSFFNAGFPAVRFTEPREDYSRQHQNVTERNGEPYGDLPQYMDFEYLTRVTALNVATLAELASAPAAPLAGRPSGTRGSYDVRVTWSPVEGASDYELVWRLTTSPDWENAILVSELPEPAERVQGRRRAGQSRGPSLRAILPGVCLDDVVVGVRSVGADGSRSRVATPPEPDAFNQRPTGQRPAGQTGGRRR